LIIAWHIGGVRIFSKAKVVTLNSNIDILMIKR